MFFLNIFSADGDTMLGKILFTSFVTLILTVLCVNDLHPREVVISETTRVGKKIKLYKDYHALVVGVGDYEHFPDLKWALPDAERVSSFLRERGFVVRKLLNPTSDELKQALGDLTYKVGKQKDLLCMQSMSLNPL